MQGSSFFAGGAGTDAHHHSNSHSQNYTHSHIPSGWEWITSVNTSPYFAAILVLLINVGGRYIAMDISPSQERFFSHPIARRVVLFAVLFLATRNALLAFVLTVAISVVLFNLLHEESPFYCLPWPRIPSQLLDPQVPAVAQGLVAGVSATARGMYEYIGIAESSPIGLLA